MRRTLLGGGIIAALVAGVLAVGLASAQTSSPTPNPTATGTPTTLADKFKTELANQLGISVDQLNSALNNTDSALIDQAVADGKLTQTEGDNLKSKIDDDHNLFPVRGGLGPRIEQRLKAGLVDEVAKVLNVDTSVVTDGLKNGDTLAKIANDHGMSTDDLKSALLAQTKTDLDAKVSSGDITQAQADKLYNGLSNNIDNIINHTPGDGGFGFFGGHGRGFRFGGPDHDGSGSPAPSTSSDTPDTSITF